jgi:hypothetical protein
VNAMTIGAARAMVDSPSDDAQISKMKRNAAKTTGEPFSSRQ